jgi:hypothetical protein
MSSEQRKQRECGACTACCDGWLKIEVRGHEVRPGKPCPFSVDHRCSIYAERPQNPCREFVCGWLYPTSPLPEWMRPDKSNLIMLPAYSFWRGIPVDFAVAVGSQPKTKALEWLKTWSVQAKRCLVYEIDGERYTFGPVGFQTEFTRQFQDRKNTASAK